MNFCTNLRLNLQPLQIDLDAIEFLQSIHKNTLPIVKLDIALLNSNFLQFLNATNLKIIHLESFYTLANSNTVPHIDIRPGDHTKINFVYLGNKSTMNWYKLKENKSLRSSITSIGTPYFYADNNDLENLESVNIQGASLVQVGVIHNIKTLEQERYCISCVIVDNNNHRLKYQDALKRLENYL